MGPYSFLCKGMRSLVTVTSLALLVLAGCGTNSDSGLQDIPLEPDLVITDVEAPGAITASQTWSVVVIVANRGGVDARAFEVEITVFSNGLRSRGSTLVETGLSASDVIEVQVSMSGIASPGVYNAEVVVDSETTVREANENNNEETFTVTVNSTDTDFPDGVFEN